MQTTRRQFIKAGTGCALGMALSPTLSSAAAQGKLIPIGFQLYTVRGEFEKDVPGTLKALGQMGYQGVEFWGYAGTPKVYRDYSGADLRRILDDNGLKCCGMHLELGALSGDKLKRTVENDQALGNIYLNVAAAKDRMVSVPKISELATLLNLASMQCRDFKMMVGYHAHPFDFVRFNGRFAWEYLFSRTLPEINMQMDVGNCLSGGGDPIAMLKEFPGRTRTIHIKEHEDKTFDSDYYKEVFRLCETTCGTRWYIVEMGGPDGMGFDVPRKALEKLHSLGK
jgi:sugar phosphate isomerase/epimerase